MSPSALFGSRRGVAAKAAASAAAILSPEAVLSPSSVTLAQLGNFGGASLEGVSPARLWHDFEDRAVSSAHLLEHQLDNVTMRSAVDLALSRYTVKDTPSGHGEHGPKQKIGDEDGDIEFPEHYSLFKKEDTVSWIVFFVLFIFLIVLDNTVLHGETERMSFHLASKYAFFWLCCAGAFNIYVYFARGAEDAFAWGTGYILEWMLSVDNLFVFRSVFLVFGTPDDQKHKPLFWGIVGAVFFRMIFFAIGEVLLHTFTFMHYLLGAFLIYTGVKIMTTDDEEDEDFQDNPVIKKITEVVPFVNCYAPTAKFFARIPDPVITPRGTYPRCQAEVPDSPNISAEKKNTPLKATRLLLVVVCLELTDVVFAVDSVSAIVAQIPDLFLAYTACVFAMLGLRATFFVVDELVKLFSLLSFAVGAILIFIGAKLFLRSYLHVPHEIVCVILISTLLLSILASILKEKYFPKAESDDEKEGSDGIKDVEVEKGVVAKEPPEDAGSIAARA